MVTVIEGSNIEGIKNYCKILLLGLGQQKVQAKILLQYSGVMWLPNLQNLWDLGPPYKKLYLYRPLRLVDFRHLFDLQDD